MNEERIPVWIGGLDRRSEIETVAREVYKEEKDRDWEEFVARCGTGAFKADPNRPRDLPEGVYLGPEEGWRPAHEAPDDAPDPEKVREYVNAAAETVPANPVCELVDLVETYIGPAPGMTPEGYRKQEREIEAAILKVKAQLAGPGKTIPVDDLRAPSPNLESGCSGVPVVDFVPEGLAIDPDRKGAWHILMAELATGQVGLVIKAGCSERYLFLRLRRAKVFRDRVIDAVADLEKALGKKT